MTHHTFLYNGEQKKQFAMLCFFLDHSFSESHVAAISTQQAIQRMVLEIQEKNCINTNSDSTFTLSLTYKQKINTITIERATWRRYLTAAIKSAHKQKPSLRIMYVGAIFACLTGFTLATLSPGAGNYFSAFSTSSSFEPTVIVLFTLLIAAALTIIGAGIAFEAVKWNRDNRKKFTEFKVMLASENYLKYVA